MPPQNRNFTPRKTWTAVVAALVACLALGGAVGGSAASAPPNDNFAAATVLASGTTVSHEGDSSSGASLEPGEPATVAGVAGGASVWYSWTPAANARVRVDTHGSNFDTLLAVYTGSSVGALTTVAADNDLFDSTSVVAFDAVAGTTYHVRVDGVSGATGTLDLHILPTPANDAFANAVTMSGVPASASGTNVGATLEPGEAATVADNVAGASVWYTWTAGAKGLVTVDTEGSTFDTLLGIYTGSSVGALTEIASNDDNPATGDLTSATSFDATPGTTYRIRVDGYLGAGGAVNVHLDEMPPPPNDDFANATILSGASASRLGDTNVAATLEPGEDLHVAGSLGGASIWYAWSAPSNGRVKIDTATSDFDTLLGVYTGGAVNALTEVASDDDDPTTGTVTSAVSFDVTAGTLYRIRVDGFQGAGGTVNLHLALATPPGAPSGVTATPGDGSATVGWNAPQSDGASAITGYRITPYVGGVAQSAVNVGLTTGSLLTGLTNGTTYTFRVAAVNAVGAGTQSPDSNAVTPKANQVISVTAHAPLSASYGTSFTVAATAPAGAVTYSSSGVCSGSGATFTITSGTGTCTLRYDQGGGAAYNAAPPLVETVNATKTGQTISITAHAPAAAALGTSFTVAATAPGGTVAYSGSGACSNAGAVFTMTSGTGSCSVAYDQPGNANYTAAPRLVETVATVPRYTLTVAKTGSGFGRVRSGTGSIDCGTVCSTVLAAGSLVTLTATPSSGSTFTGWTGPCAGTRACTLTMSTSSTVGAVFVIPRKKITCVVPPVKGKLLAKARLKIRSAHCALGATKRTWSHLVPKGAVISQRPSAGTKLRLGGRVSLVVSLGLR